MRARRPRAAALLRPACAAGTCCSCSRWWRCRTWATTSSTTRSTRWPRGTRAIPADLASFLGLFWAVVALVTLGFRTILSGRVLSRYGLVGGLLALPVAVGAGVALVSSSAALGAGAGFVFWLMAMTKLCDQSLRDSLDRSAVLVLYQPLPAPQRVRAQTAVEGIVGPLAGGVSGIVLLALVQGLQFGAVQLAWLLVVIVAAWITVAVRLRREYSDTLSRALASRRLGMGSLGLADASSRAVLLQGLRSPRAREVLYCLEALSAMGHRSYAESLPSLLDHPAPDVRREVLLSIERLRLEKAAAGVRSRAEGEPVPELRGLALRVLATVGGAEDLPRLRACLDDAAEAVRMGATAGLLRLGRGAEESSARIVADATADDAERRLFAARAIGEACVPGLGPALAGLLGTATRACARPRSWPRGAWGSPPSGRWWWRRSTSPRCDRPRSPR